MADDFFIGTGIYDITGPAAESGITGLLNTDQKTEGIHFRLYARSFIIRESSQRNCVVIVIADLWSCTQAVKNEVLKRLRYQFGDNLYNNENVQIAGTHTPNGPGGYSHYALYNYTSSGFDKQNFEAIVNGITESVKRAHNNLSPGKVYFNTGKIEECGWNRSPEAYLNNPEEERSKYDNNIDKDILVLKFEKDDGEEIGCLSWKAIQPTGLGKDGNLIGGNNKGYAAYLFEKEMKSNPVESDTFVAAFANSNCGDVSGDIKSGNPENNLDFSNMYDLGRKQFLAAKDLYDAASEKITGNIGFYLKYINLSNTSIDNSANRTFPAALGLSFIYGAENVEDPASSGTKSASFPAPVEIEDIKQDYVSSFLKFCSANIKDFSYPENLSEELIKGQGNKTIILAPGISHPYPLSPEILPVQILRIGSLAVLGIPGEISTMAGRRLREAIINILKPIGVKYIAINAYANAYAGYIITEEEYEKQNYEGALTLFGPFTLKAFRQELEKLARSAKENKNPDPGRLPRDLSTMQHLHQTNIIMDTPPWPNHRFGSIHTDAGTFYKIGDSVKVSFWGGHPINNLRIRDTFLKVERKEQDDWITVFTDRDPCTLYRWERKFMASSLITVTWMIDNDVMPGEFRIRHSGDWKAQSGKITAYEGVSGIFRVGTGLGTNDLVFRNVYNNQVDLMFYHPGDRLRLVAYKSYSLKPYDIYTWTIPADWKEAQVIFNIKNQKYYLHGRSIVTINKNGDIKIESG